MPRQLFLIVYTIEGRKVSKVRAHHSLSLPTVSGSQAGKIIHVVGTPFTRFDPVFKRNYNLANDDRKYQIVPLGEVNDQYVIDTPGDGRLVEDINAKDRIEIEAKNVDPPGVWKKPLEPLCGDDSQCWLKEYFKLLVKRNIVDQAVLDVLEAAPEF